MEPISSQSLLNGYKLKHRMLPLITNTFFFYCEGHGTLEQVVQRSCGLHIGRHHRIV